jgi:F0F1-type ATP synthase assembly protein I
MESMNSNIEQPIKEQIIIKEIEEEEDSDLDKEVTPLVDIIEKYDGNNQSVQKTTERPFLTSELIIFILCGIILILLFDKFISIGKAMRS